MNDPEITEAFRNGSVITSGVGATSPTNSVAANTSGGRSLTEKRDTDTDTDADTKPQLNRNEMDTSNRSNRSDRDNRLTSNKNSYASLFSDEEEPDLLGIGFFTVWEAGLVVSGYVGTGIVMSRNIVTGSWSTPVAVGISGIGAGLLMGVTARSLVYLIYDYFTLNSIIGTDTGGFIMGVGAGASVGSCFSRQIGPGATYITSPKTFQSAGIGSNVALSRGLGGVFVGVSIEGGFCRSRDRLNARFYGRDNLTASEILLSGEDIAIPDDDGKNLETKQMIEKLHRKLTRLCSGDASSINFNTNIGLDIDTSNNDDSECIDDDNRLRWEPLHTSGGRNRSIAGTTTELTTAEVDSKIELDVGAAPQTNRAASFEIDKAPTDATTASADEC
eukprot:jgi/Psemu1/29016/gm1.29016_g